MNKLSPLSPCFFGSIFVVLSSGCYAAPATAPAATTPAAVPATATSVASPQGSLAPLHIENKGVEVRLAANGKALLPIVIAANASADTKANATTLAEYLGKISGAKFEVTTGDGQKGIAVGTAADFPALAEGKSLMTGDPTRREEYAIRSHANGVALIGVTPLAVQHGVYDLLNRLGYRHFFQGPEWEVVPSTPNLSVAVDTRQRPDFLSRSIWYGFGTWPELRSLKADWDARNRMASSIVINPGHAYESIIKTHKKEFDAHPEYLTNPRSSKLCISNPNLRKLVVSHMLDRLAKNPELDSVSVDASDGGGWETEGACQDDKVFKSVSDRVVTLTNEVAEAVAQKYPDKYVSINAYYMHSPPPSIKVHPNVAVNVATSFIQGGYTFEQLLAGWSKQGARLIGVREYYDYWDISMGRPGRVAGGDTQHIARSIPRFYELGGRNLSSEANENWGAAGLGFYMASRLLWNSQEKPEAIVEDFLTKAFGPAREPMRAFYQLIDKSNQPLWSQDLVGRMYRHLDAALKLTDDPGVRSRLGSLVLYTRYCDMLLQWEKLEGDQAAQKALGEQILRFAYRWRRSSLVHSYILWRHSYILGGVRKLGGNIKNHPYPTETFFNVPEGKNPWKDTAPVTAQEIETFMREGIAGNPVAPFEKAKFSRDLVPATRLGLKTTVPGEYGYVRFKYTLLAWVENPANPLKFTVTGGQIAARGKTTLSLHRADAADEIEMPPVEGEGEDETANAVPGALASGSAPNDRAAHTVELKAPERGAYLIRVTEQGKGAHVTWPAGTPVVMESSTAQQTMLRGDSTMYFYVPKGTKLVGGYGGGRSVVRDATGKAAATLPIGDETFSIPVPAGQDGKVWKVERVSRFYLMTVPPYLARNADELLLPKEVVEADAPRG